MNSVNLIGRLTRDPQTRYSQDGLAVTRFTLAVDRQNKDKQADFPSIIAFGKTAENCDRYLAKGRLVAVQGRIQTGSYQNKNGDTVYTTDVIADRVQFLEWGDRKNEEHDYQQPPQQQYQPQQGYVQQSQQTPPQQQQKMDMPPTFEAVEDDLPF